MLYQSNIIYLCVYVENWADMNIQPTEAYNIDLIKGP